MAMYGPLKNSTKSFIRQYGAEMTLLRQVKTIDQNNGNVSVAETSYTIFGIISGLSFADRFKDSTTAADAKLILDCSDAKVVPVKDDIVADKNAVEYKIVRVIPVAPDGDPIIHIVLAVR